MAVKTFTGNGKCLKNILQIMLYIFYQSQFCNYNNLTIVLFLTVFFGIKAMLPEGALKQILPAPNFLNGSVHIYW